MTDRVVITGGSGKAGRAVVAGLAGAGFETLSVDLAPAPDPDQASLVADLTDLGQTTEVLAGYNMVVHLAAIPSPGIRSDAETFRINTISTYNVFSAAARLGAHRVVWASSETLIGLPFDREHPRYAPIDEEHPVLPESHYALSKLVGEQMAEQFHRWSGVPFTGLRFSNIMTEPDYQLFPGFWDDPKLRAWNLWGYVDARDVGQAVRLAMTSGLDAVDVFMVAAADTCMTQPSADLMAEVYPQVPLRDQMKGNQTLLSIDKAHARLGYRPDHSWRDYVDQA